MAQWFRRSEPPRSGGAGGPFSDDPSGGLDDLGRGERGGRGGYGYTDNPGVAASGGDGCEDGGGNYAPLTTDSMEDPDFSSTSAANAALPSPGSARAPPPALSGARRGWFGLGGRAASMPAFMPSEGDADEIPEDDEDDDPDDKVLRPGDHIYVWRNWTRAYQRHAIVISVGEEEDVVYSDEDDDDDDDDYDSARDRDNEFGVPPSAADWDGDGDGDRDRDSVRDGTDSPDDGPPPDVLGDKTADKSVPVPTPIAQVPDVAEDILIPGAATLAPVSEPAPAPAPAPNVVEDMGLIPGAAAPPPVPSAPSSGDEFELVDAYSPHPSHPELESQSESPKPQPEPEPEPEPEVDSDDFQPWPTSSSRARSPPVRSHSSPTIPSSSHPHRPHRRRKCNLAMGPDGKQDENRIIVASFYPHGSKEAGSGPTVDDVREEGAESGASLLSGEDLTGEDDEDETGRGRRRGGGAGAGSTSGSAAAAPGASSLRSHSVRQETLRAFIDHAAAQDDDDSFGASRKSNLWGRRKSKADVRKIHKVRYGASLTRRLLSRAGTSLPLPSDPRPLVLARARHLLSRPSSLPPYHPLSANGECAAVWCRTGRWCTAQAAGILQILFVGQAGSAVVAGGILSQLWVLVPMPGIWGVAGWWWWVPATVAYPLLVPLLVTYGLVSLVPLEVLRRYRKKWKGITNSLNHGFWSTATDDIKEYFGTSQSTDEDLMSRFFGPGDRGPGAGGDGDEDGAGAMYMPVNATAGGPGDDSDDEDEDDMIQRHEEAVAAAYRDEADLSGRPPGERGLGPIKRRVERIMSEWKNRGKRRSQRDFMDMAKADEDLGGGSASGLDGMGGGEASGALL